MKKPKPTYSKMPMYIISKGNGLFYNNRERRYLSKDEIEIYKDSPAVVKNEIDELIKITEIKNQWWQKYENY